MMAGGALQSDAAAAGAAPAASLLLADGGGEAANKPRSRKGMRSRARSRSHSHSHSHSNDTGDTETRRHNSSNHNHNHNHSNHNHSNTLDVAHVMDVVDAADDDEVAIDIACMHSATAGTNSGAATGADSPDATAAAAFETAIDCLRAHVFPRAVQLLEVEETKLRGIQSRLEQLQRDEGTRTDVLQKRVMQVFEMAQQARRTVLSVKPVDDAGGRAD